MKLKIALATMILFMLTGCASAGWLSGLFTVKGADSIKVADTVKVADKVADKVEASPELNTQAGYQNQTTKTTQTTTTSVGGNQAITNDKEIMIAYINSLKEQILLKTKAEEKADKRFMKLLYILFGSLFTLIGKYELQIRAINNKLLAGDEKDDEFKEDLIKTSRDRELTAQKEA